MSKIPFDQNEKRELNAKEVEELKKVYDGGVFFLNIEDKKCWLHRPDRQILDLAQASSAKKSSKFNETIIRNCWLAGDKEILTNDHYFFGASAQLDEMITFADATIKKL